MTKYYVTATDSFMSGWGKAENKTNKVVIECDNFEEASYIQEKLSKREEMKYVNVNKNKPYYNKKYYYTSYISKDDGLHLGWYK